MNKIRAIIFDFDGTLADTEQYRLNSWRRVFSEHSLICDDTRLQTLIKQGMQNRSIIESLFPELDSRAVEEILDKKLTIRSEYTKEIETFSEVRHVLETLHSKGLKLAICTGTSESTVESVLDRKRLSSFFSIIVGEESVNRPKPDSESLCRVLHDLDMLPAEVLFVGDTRIDREAANNCGILFLQSNRCDFSSPLALYKVLDLLQAQEVSEVTVSNVADSNQMLRDEYSSLKKEALQYQRFRLQILAIVIATLAIVCALPFRSAKEVSSQVELALVLLTSLSAYLLVIPGAYFTYLLSRHITFIGSYIHEFHEINTGRFGWERARRTYNEVDPKGRITTKKSFAYFYLLLGLYAFVFSLFVTIQAFEPKSTHIIGLLRSLFDRATESPFLIVFLLFDVSLFVVLLLIVIYLLRDPKLETLKSRHERWWREVKRRQMT